MAPRSPARRLAPLGCTALAALALALSACGGDGNEAAARDEAAAQAGDRTGATPRREACPRQLGDFVASLRSLRRRLVAGLSYEQYTAAMRDLRASYEEIPVARLTVDCAGAGSPGERALNRYIDAANAWGECLADASCTTAAIEPVLQREWRRASGFLAEAR